MRTSMARAETLVLGVLGIVFLGFLYGAVKDSRAETRDGIRRDEVAAFKRLLEQHYNKFEAYPLEFDASPHQYVVEARNDTAAVGWYLRAQLEHTHPATAGFDAEAGRNYWYRYVTTDGVTYYDVCGGELSCDASRDRRSE